MDEEFDPKDFLLFGLNHYNIKVLKNEGMYIQLIHDYSIEIEGPSLYKLIHENQVVGPFSSVEKLCEFIVQDIKLNYG